MDKKIILFAVLILLPGALFAYDGGGITESGMFEAEVGFEYVKFTGLYDKDGKKQDITGDPAFFLIPFSVSYGIIDGLEAGMIFTFEADNKDAGDVTGLDRPVLSVKYISPVFNMGLFADLVLPVGSEDIVGADPELEINAGIAYEAVFDAVGIDAAAEYNLTFEGDDKYRQDGLTFYLNPEYYLKEELGIFLDTEFSMSFDKIYDGDSVDDSAGYLITLSPGADYILNELVRFSLSLPFTVAGRNGSSYLGLELNSVFRF